MFATKKTHSNSNGNCLNVESLEQRIMLSTVQIYAAGGSGQETVSLQIADQEVAVFENVGGDAGAREYMQLTFETDQVVSASDVRLEFTNDLYDPETGLDRNLFVDRIVIDGVTFQSEGPSVYSTGLYRDGGVTGPGFLNTETLNINGSFFYSDNNTPRNTTNEYQVTFVARGTTGDELVELIVDDQTVKTFALDTVNHQFQFKRSESISSEQVKFEFVNDLFDQSNGIDRNVILDSLEVEDLGSNEIELFDGNSSGIFSTGTWRSVDGIVDGFGRGNTLHANGFFSFAAEPPSTSEGSLIRFTATGEASGENIQLLLDGNLYYETELSRGGQDRVGNKVFGEYQVTTDEAVDLSRLRIAFTNDGEGQFGRDRNVTVGYIYVKDLATGEIQRTTAADSSTFSTGTFSTEDGTVPGFGRGDTLQSNGYFEFANSSRLVISAGGTTGEEQFRVIVGGEVVGEFLVSEPTIAPSLQGAFFVAEIDGAANIEDVRVEFFNDGVDSFGTNRDLNVARVTLDGRTYSSISAFSTGTYLPEDGVAPGIDRGQFLHANGYFQYGAAVEPGFFEPVSSQRFPDLVQVQWLEGANAFVNQSNEFTAVEENGDVLIRFGRRGAAVGPASVTFEIVPAPFQDSVPNSIASGHVTIQFEDDQHAALLRIPVQDNSVSDGGSFLVRVIGSTGFEVGGTTLFGRISDSD